jgi:molecular chaperone GrpE
VVKHKTTDADDELEGRSAAAESASDDDRVHADATSDERTVPIIEIADDSVREELEATKSHLLRAQADLENYRKRVQRELALERQYAALPVLRDLLPVVDNIRRAIEAAEKSSEASGLLEGCKMVAQQIETVFAQHDCKPIAADGEMFDPNLHEAISQMPSAEHEQGAVIQVTQSGYQLHDRVVRPSQVVVSSGPPAAANDDASA